MGYTLTAITTHVARRTQNKSKDRVDIKQELLLAIDEFCIENHWWWRKKYGSFTTVAGTADYDLSASPNNITDLQEIEAIIPISPVSLVNDTSESGLAPIISAAGVVAAMNATENKTPSTYMIKPGFPNTVRLGSPADQAALMGVVYWAITAGTVPEDDSVPLVPGFLHWGLVYALERRIYELLYGDKDNRYKMANDRYSEFVQKAMMAQTPETGRAVEMRAGGGNAVRATR